MIEFVQSKWNPWIWTLLAAALLTAIVPSASCSAAELRLGIVGTDSSHAVEFTRILNDAQATDHVTGARVVAAFRGGNPNLPLSRDRIEKFTSQLQSKWKLHLVARIRDLCPEVDGILILSVDPESRLREFREAASCHKPIFVDKPLASTLAKAQEITTFAAQQKVPWFSSSSLRFGEVQRLHTTDVKGADVWGPGALGDRYPLDLSWYAIHSIELLYTIMGPGVQSVSRIHVDDTDIITGVWSGGRVGTIRVVRPNINFGAVLFHGGGRAEVIDNLPVAYPPLVAAIVQFIRTGRPPVPAQETLEIFTFMEAAQKSMRQGGKPVPVAKTEPKFSAH